MPEADAARPPPRFFLQFWSPRGASGGVPNLLLAHGKLIDRRQRGG